jgi:hypothetical protein
MIGDLGASSAPDLHPVAPGSRTAAEAGETVSALAQGFVSGFQVGGWIGGVVLAIVQGLTELIENVTSAKVRKTQAVEWARSLGIPNPEQVPGFIVRVQAMTTQQRLVVGLDLSKRLDGMRPGKARDRLEIERGIIAILIQLEAARARGQIAPAASPQKLVVVYGSAGDQTSAALPILALLAVSGIGVVLLWTPP